MRHLLNRFVQPALLLAALVLAGDAVAAGRIALVVGNARYADKPLKNPANDADDVARELQRLGFTVQRHQDLGRREMNEALRRFSTAASRADLAVVYYSGHGLQAGGENYLVPVDARIADERDIRSEGVALRDVLGDLEEAKVQRVVVVLDACRDNPFATRARSVKRGLARPEVGNNAALVAFATAEGRTADDGTGRNGVYTTELLQQLRKDQDIRDVFDETSLAVGRRNADQRPKVYGDTGAFKGVYFSAAARSSSNASTSARPAPSALSPEDEAWEEIKSSNSVAALSAFLKEFPNGTYAGRVRMRLASLETPATASAPAAAMPSPAQSSTSTRRASWLDK